MFWEHSNLWEQHPQLRQPIVRDHSGHAPEMSWDLLFMFGTSRRKRPVSPINLTNTSKHFCYRKSTFRNLKTFSSLYSTRLDFFSSFVVDLSSATAKKATTVCLVHRLHQVFIFPCLTKCMFWNALWAKPTFSQSKAPTKVHLMMSSQSFTPISHPEIVDWEWNRNPADHSSTVDCLLNWPLIAEAIQPGMDQISKLASFISTPLHFTPLVIPIWNCHGWRTVRCYSHSPFGLNGERGLQIILSILYLWLHFFTPVITYRFLILLYVYLQLFFSLTRKSDRFCKIGTPNKKRTPDVFETLLPPQTEQQSFTKKIWWTDVPSCLQNIFDVDAAP